MAAFVYTIATYKIATGALNLSTADIRTKLLMSNTTCGTQEDATNLAAFTTMDEYDGSGYTALDLASIMATKVDASDRTQIDAADGSFGSAVSAGTRSIVALLHYVRVDGTTTNDYPLIFDDTPPQFASGTFNGDGGPLSIALDPTGFLHLEA
jgi:hypothetical protein